MRRRSLILAGILASAACSSEPEQPPQQPAGTTGAGAGVALPTEVEQCAVLVNTINAGVIHVDQTASAAAAQGQSELKAMADALDQVADQLERTPLASDALLRVGGFYVGVLRLQSKTTRELEAAAASGDKTALEKKQADLATIEQQEAAILRDLNRHCEAAKHGGT